MADRDDLPSTRERQRAKFHEEEEEKDEEDLFSFSNEYSNSDHLTGGEEKVGWVRRRVKILEQGQLRGVLTRVEAEEEEEEEEDIDFFPREDKEMDFSNEEEIEEEEEEEEERKGFLDVPIITSSRWRETDDSEELPSPLGLPGTTPPSGSRFMKHERRTHKHRGVKKMSLGHVPKNRFRNPLKKRPCSMVSLPGSGMRETEGESEKKKGRRNTAPAISGKKPGRENVRVGRRRHGGDEGGGGGGSPLHEAGERSLQKRKKKRNQQRITHDRDEKAALNPSSPLSPSPQPVASLSPNPPRRRPPLIPVQSVDIPDYTPSLAPLDSPHDLITSSLNFLVPPHRSASGGVGEGAGPTESLHLAPPGRVYRSYSDAHVSVATAFRRGRPGQWEERENAVCPLDRKQFFKRFQRALKYAAGISRPQPHPPETPFHPHMSRFHSENLSLENPQAQRMEEMWVELQAHLHRRQREQQLEWLHISSSRVTKILTQVVHFQIMPTDPIASINTMFQASPDYQPGLHGDGCHRDGYEEVGGDGVTEETLSRDSPEKGSTDSSTVMGEDGDRGGGGGGGGEEESDVTASLRSQPWSVDSNDEAPQVNKISPKQFLSSAQISAVDRVTDMLDELEGAESLFQNRCRMGDAHPQYRTLSFRRKVDALTLWLKVTKVLAQALATLSAWLGVAIIVPEMCRDETTCLRSTSDESRTVSFAVDSSAKEEAEQGVEPASMFSVGSPSYEDIDPQQSLKRYTSRGQSSSGGSSRSRGTLQRMFSSYQSMSVEGGLRGPYRQFVDGGLKTRNLASLMESLEKFVTPVQRLCAAALTPSSPGNGGLVEDTDDAGEEDQERRPLLGLRPFLAQVNSVHTALDRYPTYPYLPSHQVAYERTSSVSTLDWRPEFEAINLPHFGKQYIQLVHTPLDVMHECLKLQLGLQLPEKPSPLSVRQLVYECRDTLEEAIKVRKKYREVMEVVTRTDHSKEQVDKDMEFFEADLNKVLMIYFNYLQKWVTVSSGHVLEEEWRHVKEICSHIRSGEAEAGRRFCDMAAHLLDSTGDMFEARMDETCHHLHDLETSVEEHRSYIMESCRQFKELFVEVRERASKAIGFAKMLRKDLEIAADFTVEVGPAELLEGLRASDHAWVKLSSPTGKLIFVPEHMKDSEEDIQQLLSVSFAHSDPSLDLKDSYILLVAMDIADTEWAGHVVQLKTSAETTIAVSEMQIECVKMIVGSSAHLANSRTSFLNAMGKAVSLTCEQTSSHENVATRIQDLKHAACKLAGQLVKAADQLEVQLCSEDRGSEDKSFQAAMHACFNLGFEYVRDVFRLVGEEMAYRELGDQILEYAQLWMRFVLEKCERGRGTRPRWASMGLDFLTLACAPRQLAHMSPTNFESLRKLMNRSLDHVVGEAPPTITTLTSFTKPIASTPVRRSPRLLQRKSSPVLKPAVSDPHAGMPYMQRPVRMENVREDEEEVREGGCEDEEDGVERQMESATRAGSRVTFQADSHSNAVRMELGLLEGGVVNSPPGSAESISSGHHSPPPVAHDDLRPMSFITPHTHPSPSSRLSPSIEREQSNTSTASANGFYSSPYSRSPSGGSGVTSSDLGGEEGGGECMARIRKRIQLLELNRDTDLRKKKVIGRVRTRQPASSSQAVRLNTLTQTHFKWQRGRKLGEGRFGKVYECRNLDTGEMMAVKQISVQEKDSGTLQTICDEIGIFQKVSHENIVQFHGLEIHHTELFLFMECCHEGTLWSIAQQGLPEHMIRRYTRDLLRAVDLLHSKGIIHRDIKGANIFLCNDSIKLGDFGLSVQLKNLNKTLPNEIKQQVGTVPYLSPEVVLKQEMGRPLDIWSVGCVVVEMATGKLPWPEYDNQYQIMFQIGTGKSPTVAKATLPDEGHDFLSHCFQSRPEDRWKAGALLTHPFVKISDVT